jgi:hypothetical protein
MLQGGELPVIIMKWRLTIRCCALISSRLLVGESPTVVTARGPRRRFPVPPGAEPLEVSGARLCPVHQTGRLRQACFASIMDSGEVGQWDASVQWAAVMAHTDVSRHS